MSELQIKKLQQSKTSNSLTMRETSSIIGGARDIINIEDSFNDTVIGGSGPDVIVTDPRQVNVDGKEIIGLEDFGVPAEFLDRI